MFRKFTVLSIVLLLALLLAPGVSAQDGGTCVGTANHPVGTRIAETYESTYEEVMGFFCGVDGVEGERYGMGEIMLAFQTSKLIEGAEGYSAAELLAMKTELGGWGQVWQELGLIGKGKYKNAEVTEGGTVPEGDEGKKGKGSPKGGGPPDHAGPKDRGGKKDRGKSKKP